VWQEFIKATSGLRREAIEDVFEIAIRVMSVELGGLDEAHHRRGALPGAK
jgi:hypothetical protein